MPDDVVDPWPTVELSRQEYERHLRELLSALAGVMTEWRIEQRSTVHAPDGSFQIDLAVHFRSSELAFVVLFDCRQQRQPIERADLEDLRVKVEALGADKGVMVATTGFRLDALAYAGRHGIACIRLAEGDPQTVTHALQVLGVDRPPRRVTAYEVYAVDGRIGFTELSDLPGRIYRAIRPLRGHRA